MSNPTAAQYKCTDIGCYDVSSPVTHSQILLFQNTINRYSAGQDIPFSPIAVDGVIGKGTATAAFWALTVASMDPAVSTDTAVAAGAYLDQLNTEEDLITHVEDLTAQLTAAANAIGLPNVPAPNVASNPTRIPTMGAGNAAAIARATSALATKTAIQSSIFDPLVGFGVPIWAQVVGGIVIFVGGFYAINRYKKTHA